MKKAFTLIEVIMAVIIVSIVVMGAMELQGKNQDMGVYISNRGKSELDNSLFLTAKAYGYDKDEKDAYELLRDEFDIKDLESREALKEITKHINITEDEEMPVSMEENGPPIFTFYTNEILLKGEYPARYYNFK
ncbi:MAG: prepilin-type N-terminal cleavage/methylation domain-containing protein [Epsilonproteobacteria bacterium]|nr:prepilin-type N-terminal cleavage/methylation domain-containing protein [Campylobacterota bacterium]